MSTPSADSVPASVLGILRVPAAMTCALYRRALGLTMRAFRTTGDERDELIREAWAVLACVATE